MPKRVMLGDNCCYFERETNSLILVKRGELTAGEEVFIGETEIGTHGRQHVSLIPVFLPDGTYYFFERECEFLEMHQLGESFLTGPIHPYIARYSEKGGGWDLLPDGFIIAKPEFTTSIPFYSKKRGLDCVEYEILHFRNLTAREGIDVAEAIQKSDLPDEYVRGDFQIMALQQANVNMRSGDVAKKQ